MLNDLEKSELFNSMNEIKVILKQLLLNGSNQILTNKQLAIELGVSRNQAYTWRKNGLIKSYGKGKKIWYLREDVIEFIKTYGNEITGTTGTI